MGFLVETLIRYYQKFYLKYLVLQIKCAKNLVFQLFDLKYRVFRTKSNVFDRNTRFFIWNTRFSIWNTKFFIGCTRYFKNMWQSYSIPSETNFYLKIIFSFNSCYVFFLKTKEYIFSSRPQLNHHKMVTAIFLTESITSILLGAYYFIHHHDKHFPANIYISKVNNRNPTKRFELCSKLKTPKRRH